MTGSGAAILDLLAPSDRHEHIDRHHSAFYVFCRSFTFFYVLRLLSVESESRAKITIGSAEDSDRQDVS